LAQTTKKALAASLKKLLNEKSLDKVTVKDITNDCEVNRQTFYYHFKDIYDLIEWIYISEARKVLEGKDTYDKWQQGFLEIFDYVIENKMFVENTYHSLSREYLERYLYNETYNLIIGVVEEKAVGMRVSKEEKAFIANFYKYGFVGLMLDWIGKGMREEPAKMIERLSILIQGDFEKALDGFRSDIKKK
jgi:probable dihydroxyacetone kinase regulator